MESGGHAKGISQRKGLELKLGGCRWRSWSSRRVIQDSSAMAKSNAEMEHQKSFCWANLPPELLREVLLRIETSEEFWPIRRNVVSCAALAEDGKFLLAARKFRRATCNDYVVSLNPDDMSKGGGTYIGKLRSNFMGTKFTIYDPQRPTSGAKMIKSHSTRLAGLKHVAHFSNYASAHISYELNVLGSRGPRRMACVMGSIPSSSIEPDGVAPTQRELPLSNLDSFRSLPFFRTKSNCTDDDLSGPLASHREGSLVLRNKAPRWHEQLQCWCLNFHGRVTVASVKNFQLVASPENEPAGPENDKIVLQFGKVGKDVFTMDYRYPISAFQAFAICLSSFDTKIALTKHSPKHPVW
ncbi:hypothetical protein V2J09_023098 [Rumex salicifolius]